MLKVGLTGGVASGKTMVLNLFEELGAQVIDADAISHEVVRPHLPAWKKIVEHFGKEYLNPDLTLNRGMLRKIVFTDDTQRKVLENIIHPEILKEIRLRCKQIEELYPKAVLIVDIPLLIEIGLVNEYNKIILVYVDKETQIKRIIGRYGISKDEALKILGAQIPMEEKIQFADFVIDNKGTIEEIKLAVSKVFEQLKALQ